VRVWMAQGSLSGERLDPVGEKIALDLTATRQRNAQNGRRGFGTHGGMRFSDEYDLELRRTTRGAGRRCACWTWRAQKWR
jgi:hypothetical protein